MYKYLQDVGVSQVGGRCRKEEGRLNISRGFDPWATSSTERAGPESMLEKSIPGRVRQGKIMSCLLFGEPVLLKGNIKTRVSWKRQSEGQMGVD